MAKEPILDAETKQKCLQSIQRYLSRDLWISWGMLKLKKSGNIVLLYGPAGTGKTTTAEWLASLLGKGLKRLNLDTVGSPEPGGSERNVRTFFKEMRDVHENPPLFLDECNTIFEGRERIATQQDNWKTGCQEAVLMELNTYAGLVICATNMVDALDPAMRSRFLAEIYIGVPATMQRREIWTAKIPKEFPCKLNRDQIATVAKFEITGRDIENVIIEWASEAISRSLPKLVVEPTFAGLMKILKRKHKQ